jgi:hypothetical protein
VYEVLKKCSIDAEAVIEADLNFFYPEATGDKLSAIK